MEEPQRLFKVTINQGTRYHALVAANDPDEAMELLLSGRFYVGDVTTEPYREVLSRPAFPIEEKAWRENPEQSGFLGVSLPSSS